jgi:NADH-quinone oxidoreductase subunit M
MYKIKMILPLFLIPSLTIMYIMNLLFWGFFPVINVSILHEIKTTFNSLVKIISLVSFGTSLAYAGYLWKTYPRFIDGQLFYPSNSFFELYHTLNLPFIILSSFVLVIVALVMWYSRVNTLLCAILTLTLEVCLVGAFSATNLFVFLLFFELSALPIFILILYCGSVRKERIKASYYFMFFTLYGSISLLLVLLSAYSIFFQVSIANASIINSTWWLLLFIAFAVKLPLFPLHIWLPHAHLEASTATSIILAALMLKLGGYGVIKYMLPAFSASTHLFFKPFALFISVFGLIYGSVVALRQLDLKRQIAFSSIAHMSFTTIGIFTFTEVGVKGAIYLMLSHGLTSTALFFLVGVLSERFHTRSVLAFGGLIGTMPLFSFFFIFMSLANIGFPGTSGFIPEVYILSSIVSDSLYYLFFVLLGMFLTTAASLVFMLRTLFGHMKTLYTNSTWPDLTKSDVVILGAIMLLIIYMGLTDIFISVNVI